MRHRRLRGVKEHRSIAVLGWLCLLVAVVPAALHAQRSTQSLNGGWSFRAVDSAGHPEANAWQSATVPGVVQTDLRRNDVIPDPYAADNEKRLQWIGDTDWEYTRQIDADAALLRHAHLDLVFEGLDTFADVTLNGVALFSADNQFRSWRVDVKPWLKPGSNRLLIVFHAPTKLIADRIAKLPYLIPGTGYEPLDRSRGLYPVSHYMRKAAYSYGWDWAPKFVTEGIWKPVRLEAWDTARIESFHVAQDSVDSARATGEALVAVPSDVSAAAVLRLRIVAPDGRVLPPIMLSTRLDLGQNLLRLPLRIDKPMRWYPNGYGKPSLYRMALTLEVAAHTVASATLRTGFRSVELRRQSDAWGTSFTFMVNSIPVFAKGANVVPMDSFPPQVTAGRRRSLLAAAQAAHMNMLRLWGGGYYEDDSFYDLCDELGLMVWQDFMFGGAMVPGDEAFQQNVQAEAVEQVRRLSDHPSLALWCGNNEVETAWKHWDDQAAFKQSVTAEQREQVWQDYVVLFRDILKSAVVQYGNGVPYWPSSPGADFDTVPPGKQDGDTHSWNVWSGGAPIADYRRVEARFVSEFGFQSMPDLRTVRSFAGDGEDLASPALASHEQFLHGFDRMQTYIHDEFGGSRDFASFVYLSQVLQAEAIQLGVEHWRASQPETMGTLFWQLNDCWPAASWSSIDYFGRWKALQYYAARFYAPLLIAAEPDGHTLRIHVVSDEQAARQATLHVWLLRFDGAVVTQSEQPVSVRPLASTAAADVSFPALDAATMFAVLTLEDNGVTLAANTVYFARAASLKLPQASIASSVRAVPGGYDVTLTSPVLARAVMLSFGSLEAEHDDNFFDLLPNRTRRIHVASKAPLAQVERSLTVRSLVDAMPQRGNGARP